MELKTLRYHSVFNARMEAAFQRYEEEAGSRWSTHFNQAVFEAINGIQLHPTHSHFDPSGFRRLNLKKFPYHILFEETLTEIKILTLRHHAQHPATDLKQIRKD